MLEQFKELVAAAKAWPVKSSTRALTSDRHRVNQQEEYSTGPHITLRSCLRAG